MMRLDDRRGSGELLPLFAPYGLRVLKTRLEFGDADWVGSGPRGECAVVAERKRVEDLVDSIQSKRLSGHQLPGMAAAYDYGYLIVEGIWKPGADGELLVQRGGGWVSYGTAVRAVNNYLMGLSLRAGMICWRTASPAETVSFLVDQYRMWEKPWREHRCHEAVYAPSEEAGGSRRLVLRPRAVSWVERFAGILPGVDRKARYVAGAFSSIQKAANASEAAWAEIQTEDVTGKKRRLGAMAAAKIVAAIRGTR